MKTRLWAAMLCYGALALAAGLTMQGLMRTAVWIFLGGLALKTLIAARLHSIDEPVPVDSDAEADSIVDARAGAPPE